MRNINPLSLGATTAIAAVLALSATPLAAQSAAVPVAAEPIVQPQPVEPAPTQVIPEVTAPPPTAQPAPVITSNPVVQPVPEPTASAEPPAAAAVTTAARPKAEPNASKASAPVRSSAPAPQPANDIAAPATDAAPPAQPVDSVDAIDAAPPAVAEPGPAAQPTSEQTRDITSTLGVAILALLALAIALVGLLFFRRRHPSAEQAKVVSATTARPIEQPVTRREAEVPASSVAAAAPVMAEPIVPRPTAFSETRSIFQRAPVAGALPSNGAAVDLPAQVPESFEERSALLKRMVEARPDRANPFTDRKARLRRARLILQSLGTTFEREPRIDLSQYPNNWPELARPRSQAA